MFKNKKEVTTAVNNWYNEFSTANRFVKMSITAVFSEIDLDELDYSTIVKGNTMLCCILNENKTEWIALKMALINISKTALMRGISYNGLYCDTCKDPLFTAIITDTGKIEKILLAYGLLKEYKDYAEVMKAPFQTSFDFEPFTFKDTHAPEEK